MEKHHRTMTYKEKMVLAAEMINEGKTYRDVANAMQYKSEGSVSRVIRDAKTQGLIKTGSEWEREVLAEKERADKAEALALELVAALRRISEILDNATCRCRCGFCEYFNAQKRADKALAKAKEVLGDE